MEKFIYVLYFKEKSFINDLRIFVLILKGKVLLELRFVEILIILNFS